MTYTEALIEYLSVPRLEVVSAEAKRLLNHGGARRQDGTYLYAAVTVTVNIADVMA